MRILGVGRARTHRVIRHLRIRAGVWCMYYFYNGSIGKVIVIKNLMVQWVKYRYKELDGTMGKVSL